MSVLVPDKGKGLLGIEARLAGWVPQIEREAFAWIETQMAPGGVKPEPNPNHLHGLLNFTLGCFVRLCLYHRFTEEGAIMVMAIPSGSTYWTLSSCLDLASCTENKALLREWFNSGAAEYVDAENAAAMDALEVEFDFLSRGEGLFEG